MVAFGQEQQFEVLVGLHQRVDQQDGTDRVNVIVHVAEDQQEFAFEFFREVGIDLVIVVRLSGQSDVAFRCHS